MKYIPPFLPFFYLSVTIESEPFIGMVDDDEIDYRSLVSTEYPDHTIEYWEQHNTSKLIPSYKGIPITEDPDEDFPELALIPYDDNSEEMGLSASEIQEELRDVYRDAQRPYDYLISDAQITGEHLYDRDPNSLTMEEFDTIRELLKIQKKLMISGTAYPTKPGHKVDYIDGIGIWVPYDWRVHQDLSALIYHNPTTIKVAVGKVYRYKSCYIWHTGAEFIEIAENFVPYQIESAIRKWVSQSLAQTWEIYDNIIFADTIPNEVITNNWEKVKTDLKGWYDAQEKIYAQIQAQYSGTLRDQLINELPVEYEEEEEQ